MPDYPGFCGPSYQAESLLTSGERSINLMPTRVESQSAASRMALSPTPGLKAFSAVDGDPVRGLFEQNGRCFAVKGGTLVELFADGSEVSRGTVAIDANPATMVTNGDGGDELFITSGDTGYILTLSTNVLTNEVSDVTMGDMIDGYFVAIDADSSTLRISDLLDGTTWSGTQIAQRNLRPDQWKALKVKYPGIFLFGEETTEVWYDAGTSTFPFEPIPGVVLPYGIEAPFSAAVSRNAMLWLAQSVDGARQVVEATGYSPTPVSTYAVELAMSRYQSASDAVGFTYQQAGHEFYVLSFPSAKATWVYDRTDQLWHERAFWNRTTGEYEAWKPRFHTYAFDTHLVGDGTAGAVYEMRTDVATDPDGNGIRRQRTAPTLQQDQRRIYLDRFQVHLEPGLGLVSGEGSDPTVTLELSRDGGKTFGNQRTRSAGKLGEYGTRVQWWKCGSGRSLVPRITMTDPIPWRITSAHVDVRQGRV